MYTFNYSKLLGRIREKELTQDKLAKLVKISGSALSLKLNNKLEFTQAQIKRICIALDIEDVTTYFFTVRL